MPREDTQFKKGDGRWKKGESGNPAGLAPGTVHLLTRLKNKLAQCPPGEERITYAEKLVMATIEDAIEKDGPSRKMLWDRLEGPIRQIVEAAVSLDHGGAREKLSSLIFAVTPEDGADEDTGLAN